MNVVLKPRYREGLRQLGAVAPWREKIDLTNGCASRFWCNRRVVFLSKCVTIHKLTARIVRVALFHGSTVLEGLGLLTVEVSGSHWVGHPKVTRIPLHEWSAGRIDLYPKTYNTHKTQISMPPAGFEPAIPATKGPQVHALHHAATGIGSCTLLLKNSGSMGIVRWVDDVPNRSCVVTNTIPVYIHCCNGTEILFMQFTSPNTIFCPDGTIPLSTDHLMECWELLYAAYNKMKVHIQLSVISTSFYPQVDYFRIVCNTMWVSLLYSMMSITRNVLMLPIPWLA
jgi:hypothetical protein